MKLPMSKIALIDVDSHNFPNLPLMKFSAYHKTLGDHVEWWNPLETYDIAYVSKVFTFTPDIEYEPRADKIFYGGTGYSLENQLPIDIEYIMPDYSLYPQFSEAYGFLTRGCPRQCKFCIVSEKEGCISKRVANLNEFHTCQRHIKLLDPNLLACNERELLLQHLASSGAWVDFTQGLDIRLLDKDCITLLNKVKTKIVHFAWDNPYEDMIIHVQRFLKHSSIKDFRRRGVYVLTNYNSTHEEDLYRVYTLRQLGFDPYIMVYDKQNAPVLVKQLQRWVNNKCVFMSCPKFEDYDSRKV